ncbi:hypothetical protein SAMN03159341_101685 [Paenibacillus sp. 1_12]|uniref:S-Ena type endospore appendage n=1 Tax=Paenibacillus sp. 1_12 TaxID=1566278 RepID=UPI0008F2E503|nr:hypothetical protein SAMN03159341_101685 [Paenibacillus sp. 1_12]
MCDGKPITYFVACSPPSSSIIRIDNNTPCTMTAIIEWHHNRETVGTIEQGQQISFAVPALRKLKIVCDGEGGIGKGTYLIKLRRRYR